MSDDYLSQPLNISPGGMFFVAFIQKFKLIKNEC